MVERPILRFPNPTRSARRKGAPRNPPRPKGPSRPSQVRTFQATFDRLQNAFSGDDPAAVLREDPSGIAPERALVFVTAGAIADFIRAATAAGFEVFAESDLEETDDFPEGFTPAGESTTLPRTLYATIPSTDAFRRILSLWGAYQDGEDYPTGAAPWWHLFDRLLELRQWGPEDRLSKDARAAIEDLLPFDENDTACIELEIWPTTSSDKRRAWRYETRRRIESLNGQVLDQSSITQPGFIYEAILAELPAYAIRAMLNNPTDVNGLATLEGIQFIMPQMIGQAVPGTPDSLSEAHGVNGEFQADAPVRVALLDSTPVAAHNALEGGVIIEDIHDLVQYSQVNNRYHATAMASLILRGDLDADGVALSDTRLVSIPLLIEDGESSTTPANRLFVDMLHVALTRLLSGEAALSPEVFVFNFSIGVRNSHFAGRIGSLARLMDWWAAREGILFVVSAGNAGDLRIPGVQPGQFESALPQMKRSLIRSSLRSFAYDRTVLAPAEALNVLTVGAVSQDLAPRNPPQVAGILSLEGNNECFPQVTSALGLGPFRSIKPDLLEAGGRIEIRALPDGEDTIIRASLNSSRTGLKAAGPIGGGNATQLSRGTSPATALVTRAILQSAEALIGEDGPYEGQELPRRQLALLTRALAVNSSRWHDEAHGLLTIETNRLGAHQHARAKEEVCRQYGYGALVRELMQQSPDGGVTLVGLGSIKKDESQVFKLPLPPSMSGERVPRSMRITLAWFSPVNPSRSQYRLASLEAVSADGEDGGEDKHWSFNLKSDGPDGRTIKRGTVWSKRLTHNSVTVPEYDDVAELPICVQCRDAAAGGLSPDDEIDFAIAVTVQVEAEVEYDIHQEVEAEIRVRLGQHA